MEAKGWRKCFPIIITVLGVTISAFHVYTAGFGVLTALRQRMLHWGVLVFLGMLLCMQKNELKTVKDKIFFCIDLAIGVGAFSTMLYAELNYAALLNRAGAYVTTDIVFGFITIVAVLWSTYRRMGKPMVIVALVALAYAFLGAYLPGQLGHKGFSLKRIIGIISYSTDGVLGSPLGASATFVITFLILAALMEQTGSGKFFIDISLAATGTKRGGPAKAAVVASGLFGTISGSAIANVVSTGTFTIPLMKKTGFDNEFAGAVEAVASTGGQIMPPIMGAAAFIMAEMIGVPYMSIVKAAILPAILYYVSCYFSIDIYSKKHHLHGVPREELPDAKAQLKHSGYLLISLILLLVMLLMGYTAMKAGFVAIIATWLLGFIRKESTVGPKKLVIALRDAACAGTDVACACACAGIITGVFQLTGLGTKLSSMIIAFSFGNLLIALVLTMVASLILGMGLPTTACYIILAIMVAPALVEMGLSRMAAHLFVLYFGVISCITPPVALAAYAAAGLAGTDPIKTGYKAFKLGITAFVVPFLFCYGPELMLEGSLINVILAVITSVAGVYFVACSTEGYLRDRRMLMPFRILMFVGAMCLLTPGWITDVVGIGAGALCFLANKRLVPVENFPASGT